MAPSTKLEDKLKRIENFLAWKYRIGPILKENGLEKYTRMKLQNQNKMNLRRSMRKT